MSNHDWDGAIQTEGRVLQVLENVQVVHSVRLGLDPRSCRRQPTFKRVACQDLNKRIHDMIGNVQPLKSFERYSCTLSYTIYIDQNEICMQVLRRRARLGKVPAVGGRDSVFARSGMP